MVWMFILWKRSSELCHQHGFECDSRRLNRQLASLYSRPHSGCCFSWQNSTVPVLLRRISGNWLHRGGSPSVFADGAHIAISGRNNRPRRIGKILTQLGDPEDFTSKSITDYKHVPVIYEYNWIELNRIWKLNALELRSTTCCRHLGMGLLDEPLAFSRGHGDFCLFWRCFVVDFIYKHGNCRNFQSNSFCVYRIADRRATARTTFHWAMPHAAKKNLNVHLFL